MSLTIFNRIRGKDLPDLIKEKTNPDSLFRVVIEQIDENDENIPSEEMINESLVKAVEQSEEDYKAGQFTRFETKEDMFEHFDKIWKEN